MTPCTGGQFINNITAPDHSNQCNSITATQGLTEHRLTHTMIKSATQEQQLQKTLGQEEHAFSASARTSHDFDQRHCETVRPTCPLAGWRFYSTLSVKVYLNVL